MRPVPAERRRVWQGWPGSRSCHTPPARQSSFGPAMPHPSRTVALTRTVRRALDRPGAALIVPLFAALTLVLTVGSLTFWRTPAEGIGYSPSIDAPSSYDAQRTCTRTPAPGTVALARWLQRTYPVTGSMGMMRACGAG